MPLPKGGKAPPPGRKSGDRSSLQRSLPLPRGRRLALPTLSFATHPHTAVRPNLQLQPAPGSEQTKNCYQPRFIFLKLTRTVWHSRPLLCFSSFCRISARRSTSGAPNSVVPALLMLALLFLPAISAFAALPASIRGTIKDSQGAVIPNARVDLLRDGRKVASVATDQLGNYRFPYLAIGTYQVHAAAPGFSAQQSEPVSLDMSSSPVLDFVLHVGAVSDQITVTATGTPVPESQVGASISV